MIITISGFDGVGKSTSVDLLSKAICKKIGGKDVSIYEVNNGVEVYNDKHDLEEIYKKLKEYDVIKTRFYLRSRKLQALQEKLMFADKAIFENDSLALTVTQMAYEESVNWYEQVISKLLNNNKIIIYDRFWYDEVAYRSLYSIKPEIIKELYEDYVHPDFSFYLYGSLNLVGMRNAEREDSDTALFKSKRKMEELLLKFDQLSVTQQMHKISVSGKSKDQIANELFNIVKEKI